LGGETDPCGRLEVVGWLVDGFRLVKPVPNQRLPLPMLMMLPLRLNRVWTGLGVGTAMMLAGCNTVGVAAEPSDVVGPEVGAAEVAEASAGSDPTAAERAKALAEIQEATRQLELERQTVQFAAWQHVKAIAEMWRGLPAEYFPGMAALAAQVETLRAEIEQGDAVMVGRIDPDALTTRNANFWRGVLETTPEDPVMALFEQMLWASRGYFDHAVWLIELHRYGPALPTGVHRVVYSLEEEMRRLRARQTMRKNQLLDQIPPEELFQVVSAARTFQPDNPDWVMTSIVMRLQMGGVKMDAIEADPVLMDGLMTGMRGDWDVVVRNHPLLGARLNPDHEVRAAANALAQQLDELGESRGAFGGRDLTRLS
jgi:hypothetical protein